MAFFRPKTIQGVTYTLGHLEPFSFEIATGANTRIVAVRFGCHCFTEKLTARHTPDFRYRHGGETRAFDLDRHTLSLVLPEMLATLGSRSVYRSQLTNYFILRQNPVTGFSGPYLVFFNVAKARSEASDVLMNIESAYMKPNMADRAAPVKFTTLIEKTAAGQPVPRGPLQVIKRK
jgi:hypothetical protein